MTTTIPTATSARIAIAFMLLGLCGAMAPAGANAAPTDDAARLVTAMRLDFTLLDAMQWHARLRGPTTDHVVYECLLKEDFARFNPALAERVADRLSNDEVASAQAFYESSAGRWYTDAALVEMHRQSGARVTKDDPQPAPDEIAQITRFIRMPVFQKLNQLLAPLPAGTLAVKAAMEAECAGPAPLKNSS